MWVYGLDWAGPGQRRLADDCECDNEPQGSMIRGEFLDQLQTSQLLKKDSAPCSKQYNHSHQVLYCDIACNILFSSCVYIFGRRKTFTNFRVHTGTGNIHIFTSILQVAGDVHRSWKQSVQCVKLFRHSSIYRHDMHREIFTCHFCLDGKLSPRFQGRVFESKRKRFEVIKGVLIKVHIFQGVAPCLLLYRYIFSNTGAGRICLLRYVCSCILQFSCHLDKFWYKRRTENTSFVNIGSVKVIYFSRPQINFYSQYTVHISRPI